MSENLLALTLPGPFELLCIFAVGLLFFGALAFLTVTLWRLSRR